MTDKPFNYRQGPMCKGATPGSRNADGTVTYRCSAPSDWTPNGERWLKAHGRNQSYVGPSVFIEWTEKDAAYEEIRAERDAAVARADRLAALIAAALPSDNSFDAEWERQARAALDEDAKRAT